MKRFSALLVLLLALAAAPAAAQPDDRGILQAFLEDNLSDAGREVRIEGFEGALSGRATVERLTVADADGIWLTIDGAVFDWNRSGLLRGQLEIAELSAEAIAVARAPRPASDMPSPEAAPFALPDLPVSVGIDALKVARLTLGAPLLGEEIVLALDGSAALAGGAGNATLSVTRLGGPEGVLAFTGAYSNASRELSLDLDLTEGADGVAVTLLGLPGRPPVGFRVEGSGPVSDFTAEIGLSTDGQRRLAGTVRLADLPDPADPDAVIQQFQANLGGDLRPMVEPQYRAFLGAEQRLATTGRRFASGRLEITDLSLRADAITLGGELSVAPDGWPERIDLTARIAPVAGDDVLLALPGEETRVAGADLALAYDAASGDAWTLSANLDRLRRADLAIDTARIEGQGTLSPGLQSVGGALDLVLEGLLPADANLARAIGQDLTGGLTFAWTPGDPLRLTELDLTGADYGLTGDLAFDGVDGQIDLAITSDLDLAARDLSRFAGVAGTALSGAADLTIAGQITPVSGAFDLALSGRAQDLAFGQPRLDPLLAGEARLSAAAVRDTTGLRLDRLSITAPTAEISASGVIATDASDLAFRLALDDVAQVLPGARGPAQVSGTATQTGPLWRLDTRATAPGAATAEFQGSVTLIDGQPGPVAGDIALTVGDLAAWRQLAGIPVAGAASLTATADGDLRDGTVQATLDGTTRDLEIGQPRLDPLLRGETRLSAAAARDATALRIDRLSVAAPTADIAASGTVAPGASDLRFRLALEDVAQIVPGATGPAEVNGTATQTGADWRLDTRATGPGAATAELKGTTTLVDGQPGPVSGTATLGIGDLSAYRDLAGRPIAGSLSLSAEAAGDLRDGTGEASLDGTGRDLRTGIPEADALLRGGQTTLAAALRREADALTIFDRLELRTPQLIADMTGSFGPSRARVRYSLDLRDLGLFVQGLNGPVTADGVVSADDGPLTVTSALTGPGGTTANVDGQIARSFANANLSVSGNAPLALANRFIAPRLAEGTARFDLRIDGAPGLGALSGTVRTDGARLTLPVLGFALSDIAAEALIGGSAAQISATARAADGGRLSLNGRTGLTAPFNADLAATIAALAVREPGIYETTVDGRLAVNGPLRGGAALTGQLALGPTEIRIPDGAAAASGSLPGLVHLNEPAPVRQTRARAGLTGGANGGSRGAGVAYPLDITVSAPARIFIRGRGLDAELGGALRLRGDTADVVTEGRFDLIRGRLDILGKRLVLSEANAQLQGDFDPFIRAVATTQNAGATIQVIVEGLASAPEVSFVSTPDLPEDEILARLLFGRDLSQISALQALQIANAIRVLAGRGGEGVVGRLRQNFGLDDLDVATDEEGQAGLRVGKYINDNIYTDVTVDTSGKSKINLNLSISPSITARGTVSSDGGSGVGVFFERDY